MAIESLLKTPSPDIIIPTRVPYERPLMEKIKGMDFPQQIINGQGKGVVCKQCSSCHGCR